MPALCQNMDNDHGSFPIVPSLDTKYKNVDCIVIRENTEGEYCGIENEIVPGVLQVCHILVGYLHSSQSCCMGAP